MLFREIPGRQEVKERLIRSVQHQKISHAQLFSASEGIGGLAMAIAYAQYISCENRADKDSCGACASCGKYARLIHPDLHFSFPFIATSKDDVASLFLKEFREAFLRDPFMSYRQWLDTLGDDKKQGNINMAECHDILRKLSYKSFEGGYKVLIMWLPEYLKETGNTLLKAIEEPPAGTLFLLVTENREQILQTILSRAQMVKIPKPEDKEVETYLADQFQADATQAATAAYLANGNMSLARELLSDLENDNEALFLAWMRMSFANDGLQVLQFVETISGIGREKQKTFIKYALQVIRDSLMVAAGSESLVRFRGRDLDLSKFSRIIHPGNLLPIVDDLEKAFYHVERNANPKILFLDLSIRMMKNLKIKNVNSHSDLLRT